MGRALLVVDVQNDFCEGGSLPVSGGAAVARPLSELALAMAAAGEAVFASRDWHPPRTHHFREWGGKWDPHCVQGTWGAEFPPDLVLPEGTVIVSKGMDPKSEGYSAFEAVDPSGKPLGDCLEERGVRQVWLGGLTTDYCVRESAMDALIRGLRVWVLVDAVGALDAEEGERALREIEAAGVRLITVGEALRVLADEYPFRAENQPAPSTTTQEASHR